MTGQYRFEVRVTPEMIRHSRILDTLYFVGTLYGILVLLLILSTRLSARMRDAAARIGRFRFLAAMIWFALFSLAVFLLTFPRTYYAGWIVPHEFQLTHQSFPSWLGDHFKGLGVNIIGGSILAALALWAMRRWRRWWIAVWLGSIPIIVFTVAIWPVVVDPLFNTFQPFTREPLRSRLLAEARRAGIPSADVYEVDASKQTTTMNAYMTGIGPTKRIVLWDTLLAKLDDDEVVATMGHEIGHYVLNHIWKGIAAGILGSLLLTFVAQQLYEWGLRRWGARWGIREERGDPASLPWLLLVVGVLSFLSAPVDSAVSRYMEHEADAYGLQLTHLNEATASTFVKFAEDAKVDPDPPRFIELWRYSHPAPAKRIRFALEQGPSPGLRPPSLR